MKKLHTIRSVTLVVKAGLESAARMSEVVETWFTHRGVPVRRFFHPTDCLPDCLGPERDLLLVFGGDGTVVSLSRYTLGMGIPVAGINFGRVGFLTELTPDDWEAPLERALEHGVRLQPRMSLCYHVKRKGELLYEGEVVNDVVVTRGKVARLVSLELAVNGQHFVFLRSDGLIMSTPTGASGYACSAGGPLLQPSINAYVVAAICPYLSSFPPLTIKPETVFSVRVAESAPDLYLTIDGQEARDLHEGDLLEVWGRPERILMADFGLKNYFERLRLVGFVQEFDRR